MVALPALGGNNSIGIDINNASQAVGSAETFVHDPTCVSPEVLQYVPAVWQYGTVSALPMFPGDSVGQGIATNDQGEVAGVSGNCHTNPAAHALLWKGSKVTQLRSLGGVMNNAPQDINELGDVVGYSDLAGDTVSHAVLWHHPKVVDLGTLPGDVTSVALGINDLGQVVGQSCDASNDCSAVLWQNGKIIDLNALIPSDSTLYLIVAYQINNQGEIVGGAYQLGTPPFPLWPPPSRACRWTQHWQALSSILPPSPTCRKM